MRTNAYNSKLFFCRCTNFGRFIRVVGNFGTANQFSVKSSIVYAYYDHVSETSIHTKYDVFVLIIALEKIAGAEIVEYVRV